MKLKSFLSFFIGCLLFLTPFSAIKAESYIPMAGDLIKVASSNAIYVVGDNLKRHLFTNQAIFWTWYDGGWSNQKVKVISQEDFEQLAEGKHVIARPGVNLIRFDNSNKIYAVAPGGVLCEVRALYGDNWQSRVIKIQSGFEVDYIRDNSCIINSTSKLPDASLIMYKGSKDIYYIDQGKKRKVTTEGFKANVFKESSIIRDVPTSMSYASDSKGIGGFEYKLGILYSFEDSSGADVANRPDLIVSDIIFPSGRILVNQDIEIKLIVRNIGGEVKSDVGLRKISFSGEGFSVKSVTHASYPTASSPLKTGQNFEVTYTGRFASSGSKNFTAKIDEPSELVEVNENNNSLSKKTTVYSQ